MSSHLLKPSFERVCEGLKMGTKFYPISLTFLFVKNLDPEPETSAAAAVKLTLLICPFLLYKSIFYFPPFHGTYFLVLSCY